MEKVLEKFSFENVGKRMHGLPYSGYEMFYHIVFAQKDILDFCVAENYESRKWPDDYWPNEQAPKNEKEWEQLKDAYFDDRDTLVAFAKKNDLSEVVKHGKDQTLMREILLVIEHTAYHMGELVVLSRLVD